MLAPIILFVYNRLEHTLKTVEALRKNELASESILYVFSDGPKEDATEEQKNKIVHVRNYIHTITGFKQIIIEEAPFNKGLANSVIYGVTKVINKHGKVIVIEDDIVTHPFFLRFMNDCLERYENRKDIFMIGGFNQQFHFPWWYRKDVYLAHRVCSWGWATWTDRWNKADWDVSDYAKICNDPQQQEIFNRGGDDLFPMLTDQMEGRIDSWAIRWEYCLYKHNATCLRPKKTLVNNCGFDGSGVHCGIIRSNYTADFYTNPTYGIRLPKRIKKVGTIENNFKFSINPTKEIFSPTYMYRFRRFLSQIGLYNYCKTIKRIICN